MKNIIKAMAGKTTVVCATVLAVIGTTFNAAAVTSAETSTEPVKEHSIQQNQSTQIKLGQSSVFVYNTLNTDVKQKVVAYAYDPSSNVMKIQFSGDASRMETVLLDRNVREELRNAYDQYLKDFSGRALNEQEKNTGKAYGAVDSTYRWGPNSRTNVKTEVGYDFVKGNPYFTLTLYENTYGPDDSLSDRRTILLTRQQAADLVGYTDEGKLSAYTQPVSADTY